MKLVNRSRVSPFRHHHCLLVITCINIILITIIYITYTYHYCPTTRGEAQQEIHTFIHRPLFYLAKSFPIRTTVTTKTTATARTTTRRTRGTSTITRSKIATSIDDADDEMDNERCSHRLGTRLMQRWNASEERYITPTSLLSPPLPSLSSPSPSLPLVSGSLSCASMNIRDMPGSTAPHSYCHAKNLYLFPNKFIRAQAPKHRSFYAMGNMQHYRFNTGAFTIIGNMTENRDIRKLSRDHMRDSIEAVQNETNHLSFYNHRVKSINETSRLVLCEKCVLLLVTREATEHQNLFHAMTDWYNTYLMLYTLNLGDGGGDNLRLLFLDGHTTGYLDSLWHDLFTPSQPILRVQDLQKKNKKIQLLYTPQAVWVPAGYSSPLYIHLRANDPCHNQVDLITDFAAFIKERLQIQDISLTLLTINYYYPTSNLSQSLAPYASGVISQHTIPFPQSSFYQGTSPRILHIVLVSRRPFQVGTLQRSRMSRQIYNEDALVTALLGLAEASSSSSSSSTFHAQHFSHLHLTFIDMARIPIIEQIRLISTTDLLIGMHGAALSHSLFLPPHGQLLELKPMKQEWKCFQHIQEWSHRAAHLQDDDDDDGDGNKDRKLKTSIGTNYGEWRNRNATRETKDKNGGDGIEVDVNEIKTEVIRLLKWRDRREGQEKKNNENNKSVMR